MGYYPELSHVLEAEQKERRFAELSEAEGGDALETGDVIQGAGGARKVRIPLTGRGKSGGGCVIYVDVVIRERIYLLLAYLQNMQADLTPEQKKLVRKLIEIIKEEYRV